MAKLARITADYESQSGALNNLTMVLEDFQRQRDNDIKLVEKDFLER